MKFQKIVSKIIKDQQEQTFDYNEFKSNLPEKPIFIKHESNFIEENRVRSIKLQDMLMQLDNVKNNPSDQTFSFS